MHHPLTIVLITLFLLLPPAVVALRFFRPKKAPWGVAFAVVIVAQWAIVLGAAMLNETPETGAAKVFALFFGWAYGLAWSTLWFGGYGVLQFIRAKRSMNGEEAGSDGSVVVNE